MARGSPQAQLRRAVFAALAGTLALLVMMTSSPQLNAQTQEGTVRLTPAISSVPVDAGSFAVFIVAEDVQHHGSLSYDDDRDTVPDRFVESDGLAAFQITIEYDARLLAFVDAEGGPDLGRTGRPFDCLPPAQELNQVTFGCVSAGAEPAGPQGDLTLATVTFEPLATGSTAFVVSAELSGPLGSDRVPVDVRGGVARITGRPNAKATAQPGVTTSTPASGQTPVGSTATPPAPGTAVQTDIAGTPTSPSATRRPDGNDGTPSVSGGGDDDSGDFRWLGFTLGGVAAVALLAMAGVIWQRGYRARA